MNQKLLQRLQAAVLLVTSVLWVLVRQTADAQRAAEQLAAQPDASGLPPARQADGSYQWREVNLKAPFSGSYNYPLFNVRNKLWAFHPEGTWHSEDGKTWTKAELPPSGLNTAYQRYVQYRGAIYALGTKEGNYPDLKLGSQIARTADFKKWEVVAQKSELPLRVFYTTVVFNGKIWFMGGTDGRKYYNDVWNSSDAVHWTRVTEHAPWEARTGGSVVVFHDKLWLLGGSIIDGRGFRDVWYSANGIEWTKASETAKGGGAYSAVVYDDKIWIVGANRNDGSFGHSVFVTSDGVNWAALSAPWAPRGAAATCVYDGKLFMTGGKYSTTENGNIKFVYYNDVWLMGRSK